MKGGEGGGDLRRRAASGRRLGDLRAAAKGGSRAAARRAAGHDERWLRRRLGDLRAAAKGGSGGGSATYGPRPAVGGTAQRREVMREERREA